MKLNAQRPQGTIAGIGTVGSRLESPNKRPGSFSGEDTHFLKIIVQAVWRAGI
jgi:hypothetical protein